MNRNRRITCRTLWQRFKYTYHQWLKHSDHPSRSQRLLRRLRACLQRLRRTGWTVKRALVGGTLLLSLVPTSTTQGQTFTLQPSASNPLDGLALGADPSSAFADLDNDGDIDVFIAKEDASILELENIGDNNTPLFQGFGPRTINVPTTTTDPPYWSLAYSGTDFVDIDGDGDLDLFVAIADGSIRYYRNDGDPSTASFNHVPGASNPLDAVDVGAKASVSFVDIDGDGVMDAFIGNAAGEIQYYKNAGTSATPQFVQQPPSNNPLSGVVGGGDYAPSFVDVDHDGDFDLFLGTGSDGFRYFENTTTGGTLTFVERMGAANPLNQVPSTTGLSATFVDIDGDNEIDVFVSKSSGEIDFYKGGVMLPVTWLGFEAEALPKGHSRLNWSTATESNNKGFEIQYAADGRSFETIAFVAGEGTTTAPQRYQYTDTAPRIGKAYYRLQQVDYDGTTTYSAIVSVEHQPANGAFALYPNPATDWLQLPRGLQGTLTLRTATGKTVLTAALNGAPRQFDVSDLAAGLYTATFQGASGATQTVRVVIE